MLRAEEVKTDISALEASLNDDESKLTEHPEEQKKCERQGKSMTQEVCMLAYTYSWGTRQKRELGVPVQYCHNVVDKSVDENVPCGCEIFKK